jgi:hypothetical protein
VLACPDCGGRLRLVATITERPVIETILEHLGLPVAPPTPAPARSPAGSTLPRPRKRARVAISTSSEAADRHH